MDIINGNIRIRALTDKDFPCLLTWLSDKRVLEFYEGTDAEFTIDTIQEHFGTALDTEGWRLIVEYQNIPIGYGQVYRVCGELYEEYAYPDTGKIVYAMDQFIGVPDYWNKGIGTAYIKMIRDHMKLHFHADAMILDPHKDNARAIRAYQKAGFQIIGELPAHELFEGKYVDCYLMEARL